MGNPTNPNRVVRVKDLNRFKTKADGLYAAYNHNHSQYAQHYEVDSERSRAENRENELQRMMLIPVNMDALTPSSTFIANNVVAINGVFYRAKQGTANFPVTLVVDDTTGKFVYNESASGHKAYVIGDDTLDEDWEVWSDSSIDFWREYFQEQLDMKQEELTLDNAPTNNSNNPVTSGGVYTAMGGLKLLPISQSDYNNLQTKDANTLYIIS